MLNLTLRRFAGAFSQNLTQLTPTISSLGQILPKATMSQQAGQYPPIEFAMRKALTTELKPVFLEVINESPLLKTEKTKIIFVTYAKVCVCRMNKVYKLK